jgi:hypothetical protein
MVPGRCSAGWPQVGGQETLEPGDAVPAERLRTLATRLRAEGYAVNWRPSAPAAARSGPRNKPADGKAESDSRLFYDKAPAA